MTVTEDTETKKIVYPHPRMELVYLTPEMAMAFLANSDVNRRLSRDRSKWLADCFTRGEHKLTNDAITFNQFGLMNNGQHRCLAVVMANLDHGLAFWVQYGAQEGAELVMDTGRPRSFSDQLRFHEVKNANSAGAATKLLWQYRNGVMTDIKDWVNRLTPSVTQLWGFFQENQQAVMDSYTRSSAVRLVVPFSMSALQVAWIVLSAIDETDAAGFFDELRMKTTQSEGVQMLQSYMLKQRRIVGRSSTGWHTGIDSRMQLALLFKTWNHYRAGTTPRMIFFRTGGAEPEKMPVPR